MFTWQRLHGREFLGRTSMILILTNQAVFITLYVVKIPPLALYFDAESNVDVIGDQSDAVTQNAWFLCALCAAISGELSILIQTGAESWGRFPATRICRWECSIVIIKYSLKMFH